LRFALHLLLKSEIHCSITLPCAVDPEERRLPVAQLKPDPSKVAVAADIPDDAAVLAPDMAEAAADDAVASDVLLVAVLVSLPQALSVNAPTAMMASRPLMRVIFTLFLHQLSRQTSPFGERSATGGGQVRTVGAPDGQRTPAE